MAIDIVTASTGTTLKAPGVYAIAAPITLSGSTR